jgi:tetratricopeptide (TPR) repeat protein
VGGAAGLALLGFVGCETWAYWQERSARRELAEEHLDEAQRHIDQALRVRGAWKSTQLLAARIARIRGAYSEAEQHLGRCEEGNGLSEEVQLEWLLLRCQRNEVDELAPVLLASVDRHHQDSAAILEALAAVYMRQTRYREALRVLDRWVELTPDRPRPLDWRGWVCNQLDQRAQAVSDYERALELQPSRSAVRLRLAEIMVGSSRHAEAVPHLERLQVELPGNPDVLTALASCRVIQSRPDEARALLDEVLTKKPDHADALTQRGKVEMDAGNFAEAEGWLRKALARAPQDADARYTLFLSLQAQTNREEDARKELDRWQQDNKTRDRLIRLLRVDLDLKPKDADLAEEAGELFLQQGEDEKGLFWLHRALALNPRHVACLRALVGHYERTNAPEKAAEYRRRLNALDPNSPSGERGVSAP